MRMNFVLGGAIALAVVWAIVGSRRSDAPIAEREAPVAQAPQAPPPAAAEPEQAPLQGEVIETLAASKYTYLRLQAPQGEVWAAVPAAAVPVRSHVVIANATRMDDFKSPTLGRTFKVIYFGTLGGAAPDSAAAATAGNLPPVGADQALPPGHPNIDNASENDSAGPFGAPSTTHGLAMNGPVSPDPALPALPAPPSTRASGRTGHVIAELAAERDALVGQRVRVRAQVTKVTDLKGNAFFHVRDASRDAQGNPVDLVVVAAVTPERGEVATFDGTLRGDVDVGIGFKYPLLLENATASKE